eukprot:254520-Alexandrium_andersonii.AAC.1
MPDDARGVQRQRLLGVVDELHARARPGAHALRGGAAARDRVRGHGPVERRELPQPHGPESLARLRDSAHQELRAQGAPRVRQDVRGARVRGQQLVRWLPRVRRGPWTPPSWPA